MPLVARCPNAACRANCPVADPARPVECPKCGKSFAVKPTLDGRAAETRRSQPASTGSPFPTLPAEFGRYHVLKLLGQGGMGAVYLAEDSNLGRQVALKIPFLEGTNSAQRAERFVREARAAAALHHPNICTVFDAGQLDGRPFLTMAYIPGSPLAEEIDPDAPMPQRRAAEIVRKVAVALEHAHGKGTVHRDLKPANVMMTADGEPVVMDFGLAKRVADVDPGEAKLTRIGGIIGTPSYMSPEQAKGQAIGPATDVYSLGVMLFEMLTGNTPYSGPLAVVMHQIIAASVPSVKEFRADADVRLEAICSKAMAKEPGGRFGSMAGFADALGKYLEPPKAFPPPIPARPVPRISSPAGRLAAFDDLDAVIACDPGRKKARRVRSSAVVAVGLLALMSLGGWLAAVGLRVAPARETPVVVKEATPAAPDLVPEGSEWAGVCWRNDGKGETLGGGTYTFIERRGRAFKALCRSGNSWKYLFEGTIDANGRIVVETKEVLAPEEEMKPREALKLTGEVGSQRMTLVGEDPHDGSKYRFELKRQLSQKAPFDFQGRWKCFHRPGGWSGVRTVEGDEHLTGADQTRGKWERDGGLIIVHFPIGREWLIVDPDKPNELNGGSGARAVTWVRQ